MHGSGRRAECLVIQTTFLGDVVLTTPLLSALAERYGPVDVVTTPAAAPLLANHPAVRRRLPVRQARRRRGARRASGGSGGASRTRRYARGVPARTDRVRSARARASLARMPRADRVRRTARAPVLYTARVAAARGPATKSSGCWPSRRGAPGRRRRPPAGAHLTDDDRAAADAWLAERAASRPDSWRWRPGSIWGTKRWPWYRRARRRARRARGGRWGAATTRRSPPTVAAAARRAWPGTRPASWALRAVGGTDRAGRRCSSPTTRPRSTWRPRWARRSWPIFGPTVPEFGFGPRGRPRRVVQQSGLCRAGPCSAARAARSARSGITGACVELDGRPACAAAVAAMSQAWSALACDYVLGIDLGGTNLVVGSVAEDGSVLHAPADASRPTPRRAPTRVRRPAGGAGRARDRARRWREVPGATRSSGVGVGAPGPLDTKSGDRPAHAEPRLGQLAAAQTASRAGSALPAALDNDANCAVLGEWWMGAARGAQHAIGITIGTGIGGGLILDGKLYHGASDCAGEIGHTTIDAERPALQVRQLRLPRGVRLGPGHRAARGRGDRGRAQTSKLPGCVDGDAREDHGADGLRGGARRRRAGRARWCATPPSSSAPGSPTCSTSSIPRSWSSAAA